VAGELHNPKAILAKRTYQWGDEQEKAFDELRNAMVRAPVLALPNATDPFILDTDASDKSVGAELIQIQEGEERAVAYGSLTLTPEQQKYCTTRKELLAIIRFSRQFRHYLLGRHFTVRTDHNSLTWLMNFKEPQGQLARWLEELSQFRSHFFLRLVLTLTHWLTPRLICQGNHVIYILVITGPV
jgi:hypothetical protein